MASGLSDIEHCPGRRKRAVGVRAVFEDPMRFDITRDPNPHIAFGFGAHFCLGVHLAKLETKCLLREFAARIETFEPAERESYVRSSFVSGIKRLPIRVTKRV